MLNSLLHKTFQPSVLAAITWQPDDTYNLVVLHKKRGKVHIYRSLSGIDEEELKEELREGTPVVICFTGKEILLKTTTQDSAAPKLLAGLLPGVKPTDFWYSVTPMSGNIHLVSIIRQETLNKQIKKLANIGLAIYGVEVGPGSLEVPLAIGLLNDTSDINTNGFDVHLDVKEQTIVSVSNQAAGTESDEIVMGDETIPVNLLLPFSAALKYLLGPDVAVGQPEIIVDQQQEVLYKNVFKYVFKAGLVIFFVLLLLNFAVYSYYYTANQQLNTKYAAVKSGLQQVEKLKKEYVLAQGFLSESGWFSQSKASFYADRLAASMPNGIRLTHLVLYPEIEQKNMLRTALPTFEVNKVEITGLVVGNAELNKWMNKLREYSWLNKLSLETYEELPGQDNGFFKLNLWIES